MKESFAPGDLADWVQGAGREHILGEGYQGRVFLYEQGGRQLVVKAPTDRPLLRWLFRKGPRQEYSIYRRLEGFRGAPRCFGLVEDRYLVLDHVDGVPFRQASLGDREREIFFQTLWEDLEEMHRRGVAHGDLKRKENLLVVEGDRPCILDFGAAVVRPGRGSPIRRFIYDTLRQFDHNAWVKLKHGRQLENLPPEDARVYRRTWVERLAHVVKKSYLRLLGRWPHDS